MERQAGQRQPSTPRKMISLPRLKRAVHKVMLRYGKSRFYRKIDLIYKVLKRFHQVQAPTANEKCRIRGLINAWLAKNDSSSSSDSEEEVEDRRLTRAQGKHFPSKIETRNKSIQVLNNAKVEKIQPACSSNTENNSNEDEIQIIRTVESRKKKNEELEEQKEQRVEEQKKKRAEDNLPPCPKAIPISSLKKTKPVFVDLTMEVGEESKVPEEENTEENKNTTREKNQDTTKFLEVGLKTDTHQHKDKIQNTKRHKIEDGTQAKDSKDRVQKKEKNVESSRDILKTKVQRKHTIRNDSGEKPKVKSVEIITIDDNEVFIKQELISESVRRESYQSISESLCEMSRICFLAPYHPICHQNQMYYNADFDCHSAEGSYIVSQVVPRRK